MSPLWCNIFTSLIKKARAFVHLQESSSNLHKYSWSRTDDTKMNWLICDVIQDLMWSQEISHNIQDYSHNATTPAVQMKWVFCDVISLHRWWERWDIWYSCGKNTVLDGSIHQMWLLRGKIKWFLCDVVSLYCW